MPLDIHVNKVEEISALSSSHSGVALYLERAAHELSHAGMPRSLVGIGRRSLQIVNLTDAATQNTRQALSPLDTFGDIFSIFGVISGVKTLWTESKGKKFSRDPIKASYEKKIWKLTLASGVLGMVLGVLTGVKLLNRFGAFKLSELAKSLGNYPVSSGGFAAFPLGSFLATIVVTRSSIDIAIATEKIKLIKLETYRTKMKLETWSSPLTPEWIEKRITHIKDEKMKEMEEEAQEIEKSVGKLAARVSAIQKKVEKVKNLSVKSPIKKWVAKIKLNRLEKKRIRLIRKQHNGCDAIEAIKKNYEQLEQKVIQWEKIKHVLQENKTKESITKQIEQFKSKKIEKWKIKKENLNLEKRKQAITIAQRTIGIISLIASIVIIGTGIGLPFVLITSSSLALFVVLSGLGVSLYNKYKKGKPIKSVSLNIKN